MSKVYDDLIQSKRPSESKVQNRNLEEEADSDRGRVLFSSPFRRMQNKAQVFSLEQNAAVRTRLSHTLEVSSIGKYIAQQVIAKFNEQELSNPLGLENKSRPFITFVETACLLHDIGNPPFGHFGERAIGDWFRKNQLKLENEIGLNSKSDPCKREWAKHFGDLANFDGNPQGFRIMASLQHDRIGSSDKNRGANLTLTQLASIIKYPLSSSKANEENGFRKGGYFLTEEHIIKQIHTELKLEKGKRHPLVNIMEAADDIAYCLSDLEDGIEKRLISPLDLANSILNLINANDITSSKRIRELQFIKETLKTVISKPEELTIYNNLWDFRSAVIRLLVDKASSTYVEKHDSILNGELNSLIRDESIEYKILKSLKDYAVRNLYNSRIVRGREITAYRVIHGLLDAHFPLLICTKSRFDNILEGNHLDSEGRNITVESSLASRIPKKYSDAYIRSCNRSDEFEAEDFVKEWSLRAHLIVDYISGMTDQYALDNYQLIAGMQVNLLD